ncbi:MAG: sensor histidine kinase [Saprospiraceae bacterium]|nr:sensor histidine kinase [Saprospiraceae bacterium]
MVNVILLTTSLYLFSWPWLFLIITICLGINFMVVRFFLEKYVFRKVKLIYKLIYDSKKDKTSQDISQESLEDVNMKVMEWAVNTKKEIASLKSLEEYRKNYVGNISHELKTPIFSIQAYLHTLLEGGLYDETINKDYLKRAADNTERLQNIVEDLDIITKLESGKAELDIKRFDIKELVRDIFLDLKSMAKKKKITLQFKDVTATSFMVMADRESIRQVFTNLLVNSIKYGKDGGTTKVSFYDMDTEVLTEISDNGIGIEDKHLKHVFDRFYRVDSSRSRKQGGSGLGLSIVKHIIEAHDQTINVRSTVDVGSTFGFTLEKANK